MTRACWRRPGRCSTGCMSTGAGRCCWAGNRHDRAAACRRAADPGRAGAARVRLRPGRGAAGGHAAAAGYSAGLVGLVLTAVVAGTVVASVLLARYADRAGRRRCYVVMYLLLGVAGVVFAAAVPLWVLLAASLTGALSTDVVESRPFTSLEQPMLALGLAGGRPVAGFGLYNPVATAAGAPGALAAGLPRLLRRWWPSAPADQRYFLVFVPVAVAGALVAARLSPAVEAPAAQRHGAARRSPVTRSRPGIWRLCGLFAVDSLGGGIGIQELVAYWQSGRFAPPAGE